MTTPNTKLTTGLISTKGQYVLGVLVAALLGLLVSPQSSLLVEFKHYIVLHTILELAAVVVATMIFAIGWRSWLNTPPLAVTVIACGFLGVAILDLGHLLSFPGMPDLFTPNTHTKTIHFWLAARGLAALTLLAGVALPWQHYSSSTRRRNLLLLSVILLCIGSSFLITQGADFLPEMFTPGTGLTSDKIFAEYSIVLLCLGAAIVLWLHRDQIQETDIPSLTLAILVTVLSGVFFTLYSSFNDIYNLIGHLYKIIAYYFLYRALAVGGIERPNRRLALAERRMAATLAALPDIMLELDERGRVYQHHHQHQHQPGSGIPAIMLGDNIYDRVPGPVASVIREAMADVDQHGTSQGRKFRLAGKKEKQRYYEVSATQLPGPNGEASESHYLMLARDITLRMHAQQERDKSHHLLTTALDKLPLGLAITQQGVDAPILYMNDSFPSIYGVAREQLSAPGSFWEQVFPDPELRASLYEQVAADIASGKPERMHWDNIPMQNDSGDIRYISVRSFRLPADNLVLTLVTDVTEQRQAERELRIASIAFESQEAIIVTDASQCILRVNQAFQDITGFSQQAVKGKHLETLYAEASREQLRSTIKQTLTQTRRWRGDIQLYHRNGELHPQRMILSAVEDESGKVTHYVADLIDTSALDQARKAIEQLELYDPLTGLANRSSLLRRLQQAVSYQQSTGHYGAALHIDLDDFKTINDTLGHHSGDLVLGQVADRLRKYTGNEASIARSAADEFIVLLGEVSESLEGTAQYSQNYAERILEYISDEYTVNKHQYYSTCSIGIAIFGPESSDAIEVLKQADIATNQAKRDERSQIAFYDPAIAEGIHEQLEIGRELRRGLAEEQLQLWYQPKVNDEGNITGAEALLRWQHPDRGLILPDTFIPTAERSGIIRQIDLWVLKEAIAQLKRWQTSTATSELTLNINITAAGFYQNDLVETLRSLLEKEQVDSRHLVIELTEGTLINDTTAARETMRELQSLGVKFSIDDFGTGYSSLAYLSQLPLNQLKIDRSFIHNLGHDTSNAAITRAIVEMASALGLDVLAEGVETQEQLDFLRGTGCKHFQGYLFGKPMPPEQFEQILQAA